jgi:hypothetical protein
MSSEKTLVIILEYQRKTRFPTRRNNARFRADDDGGVYAQKPSRAAAGPGEDTEKTVTVDRAKVEDFR